VDISVEHLGGDKDKLADFLASVVSSALTSGAPAPDQGMFLAVPQELLSRDKLALSIRIDQLRPSSVSSPSPSLEERGREPGVACLELTIDSTPSGSK
jgi:hypothetical protein